MGKSHLVLALFLSLILSVNYSYGHGVGSEIFPPIDFNGKPITLEVSSSANNSDQNNDQQISISLIDFNSKVTLRDVTFLIRSEHGDTFLFEKEFQADNGFLVFNFVSDDTDTIQINEESKNDLFSSLLGLESRKIDVIGPKLGQGGLYKFDVKILAADGYSNKLEVPLVFNAGISIAQTTSHSINDPNFDTQNIDVITYYDEISDFSYDPNSKEILFSMPFEWTHENVNQTSVVHEELVISKTFGDLLVSGFSMYINGIKLSDDIVTIDDFFSEGRVVHFIINQKELWNIFAKYENQNGMNFLIKPSSDQTQLSSVTDNGQFRILVSWEPENLKSNGNAKIIFDVTDIFLKNKPVAVNYDFSVSQNERILHHQSGVSTDSKESHNIAEFTIPPDVTGIIHLNFENLDGNNLAKTSFPVVVDRRIIGDEFSIPSWIKNNAGWWANDEIDDATFINGIEYLITNKVLVIPSDKQSDASSGRIPSWIKNNAGWWANDEINDATFIRGLQYMVQNGIIHV